MRISNLNDEELVEELTETLEYMALQYLSDVDGIVMTHGFIMAGEMCLDILLQLGKVRTDDGIHYTWMEELTDLREENRLRELANDLEKQEYLNDPLVA